MDVEEHEFILDKMIDTLELGDEFSLSYRLDTKSMSKVTITISENSSNWKNKKFEVWVRPVRSA